MQQLNAALAAQRLPSYHGLSGPLHRVLTANDTRMRTLMSPRADEPLIPAELAAGGHDCTVCVARRLALNVALTEQHLPPFDLLYNTAAAALLQGDAALQAVFDPTAPLDDGRAAAVSAAIARLKPALKRLGVRLPAHPFLCFKCGNKGAVGCAQTRCAMCCTDVDACKRHHPLW